MEFVDDDRDPFRHCHCHRPSLAIKNIPFFRSFYWSHHILLRFGIVGKDEMCTGLRGKCQRDGRKSRAFFEINKTDFPADQTESVSHSASHSSFSKVVQMSKKGAKSSNKEVLLSYGTRDIVLGKVRGYPPWPAMVSAKSR